MMMKMMMCDDGDGNDDQGNTNDYYMRQVHIDDD